MDSVIKPLDNIQIISAPSILGLRPTGVEQMADCLLTSGLEGMLNARSEVVQVPNFNHLYSPERDRTSHVLNGPTIRDFSMALGQELNKTVDRKMFPLVLGGDCSILIGIMSALKSRGAFGLIFMDAHADFYQPEKSPTGEVADMDLAIVTGRGPALLTNINGLIPYVDDENVIHLGQRDQEEAAKYGSQDIRNTVITCHSLSEIRTTGVKAIGEAVVQTMARCDVQRFWIHYDTDVLSDEINPAVDYRLPGGLQFDEVEHFLHAATTTGKVAGISTTIFNPTLDVSGRIGPRITESLCRGMGAFDRGRNC